MQNTLVVGMIILYAIIAAAISIALVIFLPQTLILHNADYPHLAHIVLAISTLSIICIATLQAIGIAIQDYLLRYQYAGTIIKKLPPLQTMETILFQIIGVGFVLLSIVLTSSLLFFSHPFSPPLLEKTLLASIAWVIYAVLLAGRYLFGWRGRRVVYYTLSGFCVLIIVSAISSQQRFPLSTPDGGMLGGGIGILPDDCQQQSMCRPCIHAWTTLDLVAPHYYQETIPASFQRELFSSQG
jgi:ABC-type uncharacterized transport system permease subunit